MARSAGALLFVNDRADIARLAGADGLHVGQDDLTVAAARTILGTGARVGLSTHTEAQIDAAVEQPVVYIAVGPVFGTSTKATGYAAVGLERVRYAASRVRLQADLVAIGGVTLDNASDAIAAGATSVAVITDLITNGSPEARVRSFLARLGSGV
jgi:thiamine-phosphate pyrophosphorylase